MSHMHRALVIVLLSCAAAHAAAPSYQREVLPILTAKCLQCHGPDGAHRKAGLRLDDEGSARETGAIVPGDADASLLVQRISHADPAERMPPADFPRQLTVEEIETLRAWIADGAQFEAHWAFTPLADVPVPAVSNTAWVRNPIDYFILSALEARGMSPAPEASRRVLIRRLYFDLIGLPPTPEEVAAFEADRAPDAVERMVERLLASPHYGERWARHWLDVVHYGETHGYDKDKRRSHAWPYRDWVIKSFNEDKPWGRFMEEQIAGDALYPDDPQAVVATGFIAAGPWDFVGHVELREGTTDKAITRNLDRDDMVATTMTSFASLTVHCARCHDHKFDPVSQRDYYSLQAVFAGVERANRPYDEDPAVHARRRRFLEEKARAAVAGKPTAFLDKLMAMQLPEPKWVYAAANTFAPEGGFSPPPGGRRDIFVLARGDVGSPGERAFPGAPDIVPALEHRFALPEDFAEGDARAALARWMSSEANPLPWRSVVNRVWQYHFGRGIVDTPNDFGRMGSAPAHPELLDWLAAEFLRNGQSLKGLHRTMVTSATYRQSGAYKEEHAALDGGNQFLWRMEPRQLEAEALRDAVLSISGKLDRSMGGPPYDGYVFEDDHSPRYRYAELNQHDPKAWRRSIYRSIVRSVPDPWMATLDCADPSQSVPTRNTTITALQALSLYNNAFITRQAQYFAERVAQEATGLEAQVARAWELALGRTANPEELEVLAGYAGEHGLAAACRVLFNMNEFIFVE